MLSEESAMGQYATETVTMMNDILVQIETEIGADPTKATEWKSQ
jgi:pyruvate kinase